MIVRSADPAALGEEPHPPEARARGGRTTAMSASVNEVGSPPPCAAALG